MHTFIVGFLLLLLTMTPAIAQEQEDTCTVLISSALEQAQQHCVALANGTACYGHIQIDATADGSDFSFEAPGDVAEIYRIRSMRLSALDEVNNTWGIALLQLRTTTPVTNETRDVSLILFGDSTVENRVEVPVTLDVTVSAGNYANVRRAANSEAGVLAVLQPAQTVKASARTQDNVWLRVEVDDIVGWVYAPILQTDGDFSTLPVADAWAPQFGPMQAFYLATGEGSCAGAPLDGLLIQTPEGTAEVNLLINEVNISLVGTAFAQARNGDEMSVEVLDGQAEVESGGVSRLVLPGARVTVPLDENGSAAGQPNALTPMREGLRHMHMTGLLQDEVEAPQPMTQEQVNEQNRQHTQAQTESENTPPGQTGDTPSGPPDCPGGSCEAPGQTGDTPSGRPDCPGGSCEAPGQTGDTPSGPPDCPGGSCEAPGQGNVPPGQEDKDK